MCVRACACVCVRVCVCVCVCVCVRVPCVRMAAILIPLNCTTGVWTMIASSFIVCLAIYSASGVYCCLNGDGEGGTKSKRQLFYSISPLTLRRPGYI